MDGTLAAIFAIIGLTDMYVTDCAVECLALGQAPARAIVQYADVQFSEESIDEELYLGYDLDRSYGPFQATYGASITGGQDAWVGAGLKWTTQRTLDIPVFFEASLMPGLYARGDGPDIGGALQFRSALGLGLEFGNGSTLTVLYDHRSNADTQPVNPGLETLAIRYAFPLD